MDYIKYAFLGIVQALTEFLPISSTAHLKLIEILLKLPYSTTLDIFAHLGTLLATIIYFKDIIIDYTKKYFIQIFWTVIFTIPIALIIDKIDYFSKMELLSVFLFVNAIFLIIINSKLKNETELNKSVQDLKISDLFVIGFLQGLSAIPSLSRSGSTIFGSILAKLDTYEAFRFSFIVSIPTIALAFLYELFKFINNKVYLQEDINLISLIIAIVFSFIFGIIALRILDNFIKQRKLQFFIIYNIILGLILSYYTGFFIKFW
jgi:undecaprenyl-diphosphatase